MLDLAANPIHAALVAPFAGGLRALMGSLAKGAEWAAARGEDRAALLARRLAPDMLDLRAQARLSADWARKAGQRLSGAEATEEPDRDDDVPALRARLGRTASALEAIDPALFLGAEGRDVTFGAGPNRSITMPGGPYLHRVAGPNLWFHLATAHAILRHAGVPVGKGDFLGLPG